GRLARFEKEECAHASRERSDEANRARRIGDVDDDAVAVALVDDAVDARPAATVSTPGGAAALSFGFSLDESNANLEIVGERRVRHHPLEKRLDALGVAMEGVGKVLGRGQDELGFRERVGVAREDARVLTYDETEVARVTSHDGNLSVPSIAGNPLSDLTFEDF